MRHAVDPRQKPLFDPAECMFSPAVLKRLREDWPGLFRGRILELMPVGALGKHFHPTLGCPTKELYGMAGAIFLKEFFDYTIQQAVDHFLFDARWHYALNVFPASGADHHAAFDRRADVESLLAPVPRAGR